MSELKLYEVSVSYQADCEDIDDEGNVFTYRDGSWSASPALVFAYSPAEAVELLRRRYRDGGDRNYVWNLEVRLTHDVKHGVVAW